MVLSSNIMKNKNLCLKFFFKPKISQLRKWAIKWNFHWIHILCVLCSSQNLLNLYSPVSFMCWWMYKETSSSIKHQKYIMQASLSSLVCGTVLFNVCSVLHKENPLSRIKWVGISFEDERWTWFVGRK